MSVVEVISAIQTKSEVIERARAFAHACGKVVTLSQDTPGFISNRVSFFCSVGTHSPLFKDLVLCRKSLFLEYCHLIGRV